MKNRFNFTKTKLYELQPPANKKKEAYYDEQIRGLTCIVQKSGHKSFHLSKRIKGKFTIIHIGKFPDFSVEEARKSAQNLLSEIAKGFDPQAEKRKLKVEMTLGQLYNIYIEQYSKVHKKSWRYDEREIPKFFGIWFNRRLSDITRPEIRYLINKIAISSGKYQANHCLQRLRGMYNRAIEWDWPGVNPAIGIKKFRVQSRDRFLMPNELPYFIRALNEEECQTFKDYFWLLLLTGVRKTNTKMMRWEEISWELNQWRIPDTKNNEPHIVVLTKQAFEILQRRKQEAKSNWVFPQENDNSKHIINEKRAFTRVKEKASLYKWLADEQLQDWITPIYESLPKYYNSGTGYKQIMELAEKSKMVLPCDLMDVRVHDLRRTLGSYQAITGSSLEVIGKSLGHKSVQATKIYARLNTDPVRESLERATDAINQFAFPISV